MEDIRPPFRRWALRAPTSPLLYYNPKSNMSVWTTKNLSDSESDCAFQLQLFSHARKMLLSDSYFRHFSLKELANVLSLRFKKGNLPYSRWFPVPSIRAFHRESMFVPLRASQSQNLWSKKSRWEISITNLTFYGKNASRFSIRLTFMYPCWSISKFSGLRSR